MKHYLSIDIDFWHNIDVAKRQLNKLFLKSGSIPKVAVMNHQQMLSFVDNSGASMLINVDEHSDVCNKNTDRFECGSWISYVNWRKQGEYFWIRNSRDLTHGSCNGQDPWNFDLDWNKVKSIYSKQEIDLCKYLKGCVGIGLCLSPCYCYNGAENIFRDMINKYNIPYKRGRRNEYFGAKRKPPE